jgi:hypothetical protein
MAETDRDSFLDRPIARVMAGGVIAGVIAVLAIQHWDDVFPPERQAAQLDPNDPVAVCIAQERAQIETMVEQNPSMAPQKDLFLQRAEARCQATAGGGNAGAPRLPSD